MAIYPQAPPFFQSHQLCRDLDPSGSTTTIQHLPGHPSISISDPVGLCDFLCREFWAADLEAVAPRLWILTTPSSANVHPLHRQKVLGREIIVTEDPRLHLLWINNRIFIKPLPTYLLSYQFWTTIMSLNSPLRHEQCRIYRAAIGFLRSYHHLIRHQSDLLIAQRDDLRLVPATLDWTDVSSFLADLERIEDTDASGRYQYGELRLSRLNFYAPLLFHRFYYEHIPVQYGEYFARLYGPILFVFAVVTTVLNAMQVALAANQGLESSNYYLWEIFYWFGIVALLIAASIGCSFVAIWIGMVANEWRFTLKNRPRPRSKNLST